MNHSESVVFIFLIILNALIRQLSFGMGIPADIITRCHVVLSWQ